RWRKAAVSYSVNLLAVVSPKNAKRRFAQAHRLFEHRVEGRRQIAWGRIDDPQDLGGRGLLFEGLARLGDQPRVFHAEYRLRREVLDQRDLFLRERAGLLPENTQSTAHGPVFPHRHDQWDPKAARPDTG